MADSILSGLRGSLRAYVKREVHRVCRENPNFRRSRYSFWRRAIDTLVVDRSIGGFCLLYFVVLATTLFAEWLGHRDIWEHTLSYPRTLSLSFLKDVASYLITAQIGVLAIVSVAVGVVTLLSERDDGASINTDIRLYYVESYSRELAVSGVALLLVLTVQMFWPAQHILHALSYRQVGTWSELTLSIAHSMWFCVNLLLFFQFISTTLHFVEPSSRESLRERYSANEVIPNDAAARLTNVLYANLCQTIFGNVDPEKGPIVFFGHNFLENTTPEIYVDFGSQARLVDVYVRPLKWALSRWQRRVRAQPAQRRRFGAPLWNDSIAVAPNFEGELTGRTPLLWRTGAVGLSPIEQWVIRRSLRFSRTSLSREGLTPDNFLEQLVDRVVRQIEQGTITGFRAALREAVKYHSFVLAAQNTVDEDGNPFNLAEVSNGMSRPDADWVHQYRRAFAVACDRMGTDTAFINHLSNLASRLTPQDGISFSPRVIETLLDLGPQEAQAFEDWVSKRNASDLDQGGLTGSDKRAYDDALIGFIGGWESLLQFLTYSFATHGDKAKNDAILWSNFSRALPILRTHLKWTSYFLAIAVWNNDALGADRYRDQLLRWLSAFYLEIDRAHGFRNTFLFLPDLADREWNDIRIEATSRMAYGQEALLPGAVIGVVLRELHFDAICITGLIALHWHATGIQSSGLAAETAVLTLNQQRRIEDGTLLGADRPKGAFRLLLDFVVRYALNPRFKKGSYTATVDSLIARLLDLASPNMIGGRLYSSFGSEGLEKIYYTLLAALAATVATTKDHEIAELLETLKVEERLQSDKAATHFVWTMNRLVQCIDQVQSGTRETYDRALLAFDKEIDIEVVTKRLREILLSAASTVEQLRKQRIADAPLDEERLKRLRHYVSQSVLNAGSCPSCFIGYRIEADRTDAIPPSPGRFGRFSRGLFTSPPMASTSFDEIPGMFREMVHDVLTGVFWRSLYHRPKRLTTADISKATDGFWQTIFAASGDVGPEPILLVPYEPIGSELTMAGFLDGNVAGTPLVKEEGIGGARGTNYLGTLNGIRVYNAPALDKQAILCSSRLVESLTYGVVNSPDDLVDFSFIVDEDVERCLIEFHFAQRINWADHPFLEVQFEEAGEGVVATI